MLAAALLITSCASSNPKPESAKIDYDNVVTADGEKLICKSERVTGTHLKTITCMTIAQKAQARKDSEMFLDKMRRATKQVGDEGG